MSARARVAYFARAAGQDLRHAPFVHLVSVVTLAIALLGLGLVRAGMGLADAVLGVLHTDVQLTVYLRAGATPSEAEGVRAALRQAGGGAARLVTPTEALARLSRELGASADTLSSLPENPLPYSVEVAVPRERQAPQELAALAQRARTLPQVETVDYGEEAVARLSRLAVALRVGGLVALVLLALATVVTVAATFQLAIYARRAEVEIQKLVGATDGFVRAPFLIEGLVQGGLAASLALMLLWAGLRSAQMPLASLLAFLGLPLGVAPHLGVRLVLELMGTGLVLGLFGSGVAVRRFLRS